MQLLSVGRSLCGIKNEPSRYKMTQENLLPRFGSSKSLGTSDTLETPPQSANTPAIETDCRFPIGPSEPENRSNKAADAEKERRTASPDTVKAPAQAFPLGRWTIRKNPFNKPAAARQMEDPAQGELSLDAVKVIRNDLSDADLEVVASKKQPEPTKKSQVEKAPEGHESMGLAWGRITARILGVGRTH